MTCSMFHSMFNELKELNYFLKKKTSSGVLQCKMLLTCFQITQNSIMQNNVSKYSAYKAEWRLINCSWQHAKKAFVALNSYYYQRSPNENKADHIRGIDYVTIHRYYTHKYIYKW